MSYKSLKGRLKPKTRMLLHTASGRRRLYPRGKSVASTRRRLEMAEYLRRQRKAQDFKKTWKRMVG